MRIAFLILVVLHGLIHFLGFFKGFGLAEKKVLCLPISKSVGLLWLVTGSIFLTYGISWWSAYKFSWLLAFVAVTVSQVLVTRNWRDAKAATIPNLVILAVAVASVPSEIPFKNGIFQYL